MPCALGLSVIVIYMTSIHEVTHMWPIRANFVNALFFLLRYIPAFQFVLSITMRGAAHGSIAHSICSAWSLILIVTITTGVFASQGLLFLRVYVFCGPTMRRKVFLLGQGVMTAAVSLFLIVRYQLGVKLLQVPVEIARCPQTATNARLLAIVWAVVFVNEALMTALTMLGGYRKHRLTAAPLPLIFCRNGATYFMVLGAISACNIVASFLDHEYIYLTLVLQHTLHALCATRMILHIRKTAHIDTITLGFTMDSIPWTRHSIRFTKSFLSESDVATAVEHKC
ncbi:hypothetical protein FA15DRAFT_323827 [Coprinopsis marcescibilis]|uniref:Uncharacterized protein n=1 Tax=Coprinopsis marcescibilis TaxID=230819 RepID=A0A5C3KZW0_COPMA|nr:hypothetical protein FA15DRAFT_323827 [Coprinopsis marcescibilis]